MIAKWLGIIKGNIKATLLESYTKNIDYILLMPDQKQKHGSGGHNKETILLTEDCFKSMCMRSNSIKAEKVRYYYITLEKLVKNYTNDMLQKQAQKIEKLELDLKKPLYPVKGALYVLSIDDGHKLGRTNNLNKRFDTYYTSHQHKP